MLVGWMDHDAAVNFLTKNCVSDPPFTPASAEAVWEQYRDRAAALPEREAAAPRRLPLNPHEREHADRFLAFIPSLGPTTVADVIKVAIMDLVVHQPILVVGHSEQYNNRLGGDAWLHEALPLAPREAARINSRFTQNGLHSAVDIDIPHAEFAFLPDRTGQYFSAHQLQSLISVMRCAGTGQERLIVKTGFHRLYARARSMMPAAATVPTAVVALDRNTFARPPGNAPGTGVTAATSGLWPTGRRPALFADFFNEDLLFRVNVRQKRYQLQVRSTWVEIDV
jgi:hypothetical protein